MGLTTSESWLKLKAVQSLLIKLSAIKESHQKCIGDWSIIYAEKEESCTKVTFPLQLFFQWSIKLFAGLNDGSFLPNMCTSISCFSKKAATIKLNVACMLYVARTTYIVQAAGKICQLEAIIGKSAHTDTTTCASRSYYEAAAMHFLFLSCQIIC